MDEKTSKPLLRGVIWVGVGAAVTLSVVAVALFAGWFLWDQLTWRMPMVNGSGMMQRGTFGNGFGRSGFGETCDVPRRGFGPGPRRQEQAPGVCAPGSAWERQATEEGTLTLDEAERAFERYLGEIGYDDLELSEVMEFEHNFYAIAEETETGMGAMELLLDKNTGAVGPEMGPNMMWNEKYGMHGGRGPGMMGSWDREPGNNMTEDEVLSIAQTWLDEERAGIDVEEHADAFYGYYTIHTVRDGEIEGMLSVHGDSGEVWYHTWHGEFVEMVEHEESH